MLIDGLKQRHFGTSERVLEGFPEPRQPWIASVPAVVQAFYPGQEGGRALADVLFGDADPAGRLPITFPRRWEDSPAYGHYPGKDGAVRYEEGIFVGVSAGGTFGAAMKVCADAPNGSTVLAMLPDTGERYLSTGLFADVPADMTEEEQAIAKSVT